VYQSTPQGDRKVNHLFRADFFGEKALLNDEPREASVEAATRVVCLTLRRDTFVELLGPLEEIMSREKSPQAGRTGVSWGVGGARERPRGSSAAGPRLPFSSSSGRP
jgi:Cyclic nucleotide-binding domain